MEENREEKRHEQPSGHEWEAYWRECDARLDDLALDRETEEAW